METIIDNRFDKRYLIEITADDVTLEGVTVSDSDESMTSPIGALICLNSDNNRIIRNFVNNTDSYGVYISSLSNSNFVSSNIINNTKVGIYIYSSSTNDVTNNEIYNCSEYGIYAESLPSSSRLYGNIINGSNSGIYVINSDAINISNNTITASQYNLIYLLGDSNSILNDNILENSSGNGIYLASSACLVINNKISSNTRGILLAKDNNIVRNNTLLSQSASGIYVQSNSNNNILYLNRFIDNGISAKDDGNNRWYYGSRGNYWSDYNNADKDLDGIGDVIYSKRGVSDPYPLGYFLKPPNKPSEPSPGKYETGVGLIVTLSVHVEDPDSDQLTVSFYNADNDNLINSITQNPLKYVQNDSTAECKFTLGFDTIFAWYAIADDGILQNKSEPFVFSTRKTPPDNKPPIADAGGPYFTDVDQQVQFDSSGSYDPDGTIAFYRWNFGDGSSDILEENPIHIYKSAMEYQVTLTIIDNNGSSASSTTYVSVGTSENDPPVAKINNLLETAKTGNRILFDASESYDPDGDTLDFLWEFGDGHHSYDENTTYRYSSPGTYTITLTVSDGEYNDVATTIITIKTKKSSSTSGFEIMLLIAAAAIILIINKKIKV